MKLILPFTASLLAALTVFAQEPRSPGTERQIGIIRRIDAAARELTVTLDGGSDKRVVAAPQASVLRVAPGEKDLSKAITIPLSEIQAGDRVLIRGTTREDQVLVAGTIVVISKNDLVRKHEAERAEWKSRGISGKVVAVDSDRRELIIITPARPTSAKVVIRLADNASQRRYRSDSTRFSDARPATLAEIKIGDQIHALGDKSADSVIFTAQQIVSGSFRTFAAVVVSVDVAKRVLSVTEAESDKPVVVQINQDSILRRLTPDITRQLAKSRPETAEPTMPPKGGTLDVQSLLERMPILSLEELKPGNALIIASTANPGPVSAVAILSGAEPLLARSLAAQRELLGSWDLNLEPNLP